LQDKSIAGSSKGSNACGKCVVKEVKMLGLEDPWVAAAYILCILSSIVCVVYGAVNWNKGDEQLDDEERHWAEEEHKLEDEL
jgi:hypothetical protein